MAIDFFAAAKKGMRMAFPIDKEILLVLVSSLVFFVVMLFIQLHFQNASAVST